VISVQPANLGLLLFPFELSFLNMVTPVDCGCSTTIGWEKRAEHVTNGVDYQPSFQTIAFLMEETGECGEQERKNSDGQAEKFYRDLKQRGISVQVGMKATGYSRTFERLLAELGFELWIGLLLFDPLGLDHRRMPTARTPKSCCG